MAGAANNHVAAHDVWACCCDDECPMEIGMFRIIIAVGALLLFLQLTTLSQCLPHSSRHLAKVNKNHHFSM
jgi:hypothetical protein